MHSTATDVADTLAAVLRAEPDWNALPAEVALSDSHVAAGMPREGSRQRIADISAALFVLRHQATLAAAVGSDQRRTTLGVSDMRRVAFFTTAALILGALLAGAASGG